MKEEKDNKQKMDNYREKIMWVCTIILAIAGILFFGVQKKGYHVDEMFSYGLANSQYLPFLQFGESDYAMKEFMEEYGAGSNVVELVQNIAKDIRLVREGQKDVILEHWYQAKANQAEMTRSTWVTGEYYQNYLTASDENRFHYVSVYYNQRADVHPPLFYLMLHTVSSFFPGVFSKWFGIGLNIGYLLITLWAMRVLTEQLFHSSYLARLITLLYVCSSGYVTTGLYIRMYALLTMWVMIVCLLHVKLYDGDFDLNKKGNVKLGLAVLGGYLTHYYFVIYMLMVAMVMVVLLLCHKRYRECIRYCLTMVVTGCVGLVIWPFSLSHVFRGYRGTASLETLSKGQFTWEKFLTMKAKIVYYMLGRQAWILDVVLLFGIIALILAIKHKTNARRMLELGIFMYLPSVVYFLAVAQIVPTCEERYIMCLFPFAMIFIFGNCYIATREMFTGLKRKYPENRMLAVMTVLAVTMAIFINPFVREPDYVYMDGQETVVIPLNTDCIFVVPDGNPVESTADACILAQCRSIGMGYRSELKTLADDYQYDRDSNLMIAVWVGQDVDEVVEEVKETFHVTHLQETDRVYNSGMTMVWLGTGEDDAF